MKDKTHLYVLVFKNGQIIKIGKADDVDVRIQSLTRSWGEVDYDRSYQIHLPRDLVFEIESYLKNRLSQYAVERTEGDGRTEIFSSDAIDDAIEHIGRSLKSNSVPVQLRKGIPMDSTTLRSYKNDRFPQLRRQSKYFFETLSQLNEKFYRINQLLFFLLRNQNRIIYQYDVIDGDLYFRLTPAQKYVPIYKDIFQMFHFSIHDFGSELHICPVSAHKAGDVLQFEIRLFDKGGIRYHEFISHFVARAERILTKLPRRSPAATQEVPIVYDC